MTNYESIDPNSVRKIFAKYFSINKITHETGFCCDTVCRECLFYGIDCQRRKNEWLNQPVITPNDPEKDIDWSKVPVDTPVIVWDSGSNQYNRYFYGIICGRFCVYRNGGTSWSSAYDVQFWEHCKLYRPEDIEKYRKKETRNE